MLDPQLEIHNGLLVAKPPLFPVQSVHQLVVVWITIAVSRYHHHQILVFTIIARLALSEATDYTLTSWWANAWHRAILSHQHPMRTYSRSLTKTAPSQVVSPYCDVDHGKSGSFESLQADNTSSQIIPVRCFSCGKVIGDKWNAYLEVNCSRGT